MRSNPPLKRVKSVRFTQNKYNRHAEGKNEFTLECGHVVVSKASEGEPSRKRCRQCQYEDTK